MNQVFALNNEKSWQSLCLTDDKLFLINKSYSNPNDFMKGYEDGGLGRLLKQKKEIELQYITGLQHPEKEATELTVLHDGKKTMLKFTNNSDLQQVAGYLATERKFLKDTQQLSSLKAIQSPLIGLVISAVFGWVLFSEAQTLEAGGTIEITGRRAGFKRLMAWLAETLGTQGVLLVAGLAVIACGYFIYKNLKTPPNQVVYAG